MNIFTLEPFDDEGRLCSFYTVRWADAGISETDKFFEKFNSDGSLKRFLQELAKFLEVVIGDERGALAEFFRFENAAQALPPSGKNEISEITIDYWNFPLRLYGLRISDSLVVLFNGAEKTSKDAQGGSTSFVFREANQFANRILNALQDKEIEIASNQREFQSCDGSDEIIL